MGKSLSKLILPMMCAVFFVEAGTHTQETQISEKPRHEILARYCDPNADTLGLLATTASVSKERMFVIARLGKAERQRMNRRRLHNVREFFRSNTRDYFEQGKIVFAEGEPTKGQGQVEFYIGSQFYAKASFDRDENFCVDCCDWPDTRYYGRGKAKEDRRYKVK